MVTRDKERHYIMINLRRRHNNCKYTSTQHKAPQYIRQMLTAIKEEIDSNTIRVGKIKTPLISMERSSRQKINKETHDLNDTLEQNDLIDTYRAFHPKAAEYTFFSSAHGTFSRIDHILSHKVSL